MAEIWLVYRAVTFGIPRKSADFLVDDIDVLYWPVYVLSLVSMKNPKCCTTRNSSLVCLNANEIKSLWWKLSSDQTIWKSDSKILSHPFFLSNYPCFQAILSHLKCPTCRKCDKSQNTRELHSGPIWKATSPVNWNRRTDGQNRLENY